MHHIFHTDNIFYAPPGQPLRIHDLTTWRRIELHAQTLALLLDEVWRDPIEERAQVALAFAEPPDDATTENLEADIESFVNSLPYVPSNPASTHSGDLLRAIFHPLQPTFWARISQKPLESFYHEDYEETPDPGPLFASAGRCYGSIAFNALGDVECPLPDERTPAFNLSHVAGVEVARSETMDPLEPLPLVNEYSGFLGSSNQGHMTTIDLNVAIPKVCLAASPIRRAGADRYETLYFQLEIGEGASPVVPFHPARQRRLASVLKQAGFTPVRRGKRFSILTRGDDVIHLYRDLPGKESEGVLALPPFALMAMADGSHEREARSAALREILGGPPVRSIQ